jgi:mRNA interferase RelE/StbE
LVTYRVEFTRTAERDLSRLDKTVAQQVLDKLRWLAGNADSVRHKVLTAHLRDAFSLRIGDYRAIYGRDRTRRRIIVHMVRHRSEVYRIS